MSYRITQEEDKQPIVWPKRVQIIIDEYKKATKGFKGFKLDYQVETAI